MILCFEAEGAKNENSPSATFRQSKGSLLGTESELVSGVGPRDEHGKNVVMTIKCWVCGVTAQDMRSNF